jgi:ribosomal protein L11 methylase PrmA
LRYLLFRSDAQQRETLITELWEFGTLGVVEEAEILRAYFDDVTDLTGISEKQRPLLLETGSLSADCIPSCGGYNLDPICVGERLFIVSPGSDVVTPPGRLRLVLEAGDAFGSGRHESTQLVVEALEKYLEAGMKVVDIGCGSGVLSAVSLMLGAESVIACDIHMGAVLCAHRQFPSVGFFLGSADAILSGCADIIVANISAKVIDSISRELSRVAKPGGLLILAGFVQDRPPECFQPQEVYGRNDWLCWICSPESLVNTAPGLRRSLQPFPSQWW